MTNEEEIRTVLRDMDADTIRDALAMMLSGAQEKPNSKQAGYEVQYANFAQALNSLKKRYSFPELALFTTEADLVYVQAGDRRFLLTDREAQEKQALEERKKNIKDTESISNETNAETERFENAFENRTSETGRFSHLEL